MSGLTYDVCLVYLDDILVFSRTFDEHLERLELLCSIGSTAICSSSSRLNVVFFSARFLS